MNTYKLLVVDDSALSRKLLEAAFEAESYVTLTARDGQEAMDILLTEAVDLIVTDILMPNVDGYYLCYKVRHHEKLRNIPIIIYTATYTSLSEEKIAEDMGADLFIRKPAPIHVLVEAVRTLLLNPARRPAVIKSSPVSMEVMHQYSSDLVNKLEQRNIALEEIRRNLEHTVQERTRELQRTNEELMASNEELKAINEELSSTNDKLVEATQVIHQQSETIIRQKDEQLNRVLDSSNDVIWSADLTGQGHHYVSRSVERLTGVPVTEVMDFSWWMKFVHPDDRSIRQASADELQHQEASTCTYRLVDQHGQTHWMRELIRVDRNADGVPIRRVGVATDITPLKKAEIALNRERNLLRTLIDNIPDYIYIKDLALTHVLNNRANLTLLGAQSEKETLGKTLIDYFGPEVAPYLVDDQRVINTGEPLINQEEKLQSEALGERLLLTTKVPLRDDAGNITGVIGISRDITEHRQQEVTLRRYQENLGIIFSSTREDILLLDHEGKVVLFNAAQERFLLNATGKQIQEGQYLWDITLPERKAAARALFEEVVTRQLPLVTQSTAVVDGDLVAQELRYEPIRVDGVVKYVSVISIDITERKLHEIEMHKSQHLLIKAYEIAKIGYWTYDTEADHAEWNEQTRKIFGVSSVYQPALQSYLALVYPGDQQRVEEEALKAINNGELFNVEHRIIRKDDGSLRWVHVRADFIQQENEDRLMLGVIQDISERKTFEEVLLEYNQRYEILSRATNDAIWDRDIERDSEVWNHGIETIFGYADRQISTAKEWWKEKIHPEDFERVNLEIGQAFAQLRTNWISQYRYRCADQTYKYVLNRAYIIYQDEHPVRMIGSMQDITSQKEFERNITAIARELSELIQHANAPIFGADRNGYINEWNRVTEELTGYSKNEMLGKSIGLCIREDHRQEFMLLLQRVFKGSPLDNLQLPMMSKDQRDLIFLLNTTPRRNSEQQITGVLMVGQNITELIEYRVNLEAKVQERTRELNEALRKEKELVEMKSRFVSIASHEFRTPLSTIALATGFLRKHREKISSDDFIKKLATIEKQVDHMTYLLDDILMIGKSEAGKIKTKYTQVDIETFFQQTAREVEESMRTHQVQTFIQCSVKSFTADEKLLRNILINLITNAIKFSPDQKSIMLRVTNSPDYLKLEVKDKGIGITPEDQQNVFSAFHRGTNVGAIQGTGLGLSIVKKAVDLLAGQIHLSSQAGEGTSFTITLPLRV